VSELHPQKSGGNQRSPDFLWILTRQFGIKVYNINRGILI